jgi:hypothetical protein
VYMNFGCNRLKTFAQAVNNRVASGRHVGNSFALYNYCGDPLLSMCACMCLLYCISREMKKSAFGAIDTLIPYERHAWRNA